MDRPLLQGYDAYSMEVTIHFRDHGQYWWLSIVDGRIRDIGGPAESAPDATVIFDVDEAVFFEITTGALSPQRAFFAHRTAIRGNLFDGMKLAKLLGLFFGQYPYRPEEMPK